MGSQANESPIGFGARLKEAREKKRMSGAELGKGLQKGRDALRSTISDWEAERHYPNVWQLAEICRRLGVSSDMLLFGIDSEGREKVSQARSVIEQLGDAERAELQAMLNRKGVESDVIERKMPITKTLKSPRKEAP